MELDLNDRLVVVDQGPVVVGFGLRQTPLGFEQQVELLNVTSEADINFGRKSNVTGGEK